MALLVLAMLAGASTAAAAQDAVLSGRVTTRQGAPLAGSRVQARDVATDAGPSALTDGGGRYSLRVRAGREYALSVERTGFVAGTILVDIPAGSPGAVRDLRLVAVTETATTLDPLIVRAPPRVPHPTRRGDAPGASLTSRSGSISDSYPGDPGDLLASAGISGQIVPVGRTGLSVAGQPPSANRVTLDGAGFDASSLPPEAMAAAGVFTHPYDVSRGQFTGGEIAGRTMSGTNLWGGALRASYQDPHLGGATSAAQVTRVGGGGGGPLVRGRAFVYGAGQLSLQESARRSLDPADPGLRGYGISADSALRLVQIVDGLGLRDSRGDGDGSTRSGAMVLRFDYLAGARHSLTARLDARGFGSTGRLNSPFSASGGGRDRELSGGVLVQALSKLGRGVTHEASVYRSATDQRSAPGVEAPTGWVWLHSDLGAGRQGSSVLSFEGDPLSLPEEDRSAIEVTDRLVVPLDAGRHRLQLGGVFARERVERSARADRFGTFTFASLAELEAGRPLQFTRWLDGGVGTMETTSWGGFLGDLWTPRQGLRITYGVRAERTGYDAPGNAAGPGFGLASAPLASRWSVSPRAGFTWARSRPTHDWIVRGGAGRFRGGAPTRSLAALLAEPGMAGGVRLVCIGAAVPTPQWASYRADPTTIPRRCATDAPGLASDRAGVTGFEPGFGVSAVWHSSAEVSWLHKPTLTSLEATLSVSRGGGLPLATDRNLAAAPAFRLADEDGRPLYVDAAAMDPLSGRSVLSGSRRDDGVGVVRAVGASGRSAAEQLSVTAARMTALGLVQAYYTLTRSRDDAPALPVPGAPLASAAGDPRRATWATADFEQRHAFQLSVEHRLARFLSLTLHGRMLSGLPFTPMTDADVNGDGFANDRAFVFDPTTAGDSALARGMARLLDDAPAGARACLRRQFGEIAGRNGCRAPWSSQLDLQLNYRPGGAHRGRMAFTVVAHNATAALDHLINGAAGAHGWGQEAAPDPVLLRVAGFDAASRRFRYQVNPSFGRDGVSRVPFSVRLQARVTLGADPATQALVASVSNLQASMTPAEVRREILRQWANVPALVLAHAAPRRLGLSEEQTRRLRVTADSVARGVSALAATLADDEGDPRELLARAQTLLSGGFDTTREILSREQWSRLPRPVREPPRAVVPISARGGIVLAPDL